MRIAPHQIHNVLRAYVRRLKNSQAALGDREGWQAPASLEDKRRLIGSKISTNIIEKIILVRQPSNPATTPSALPAHRSQNARPADRFTYRLINPSGEEIITHMEIEGPDFLIRQMDPSRPEPGETS